MDSRDLELMEEVIEKWDEILKTVKKEHEISPVSFDTWMRPLEVYAVEENTLYILGSADNNWLNLKEVSVFPEPVVCHT